MAAFAPRSVQPLAYGVVGVEVACWRDRVGGPDPLAAVARPQLYRPLAARKGMARGGKKT